MRSIWLLVTILFLQGSLLSQNTSPATNSGTAASSETESDSTALLKVKRIYVDSFGDDAISKELQSMIVSSLVSSKRFKVTENRERADAVLKGTATEKTSQEVHAYGDSTNVGGAAGGSHGEVSGRWGSSSGGFVAHHMGISDSSVNTETLNDARVAIRLVNSDGDVIWTTTQESKGAKYKGATADAAEKCVKKLIRDVERIEGATKGPEPAPELQKPTPDPHPE